MEAFVALWSSIVNFLKIQKKTFLSHINNSLDNIIIIHIW